MPVSHHGWSPQRPAAAAADDPPATIMVTSAAHAKARNLVPISHSRPGDRDRYRHDPDRSPACELPGQREGAESAFPVEAISPKTKYMQGLLAPVKQERHY